MRAVSCSRWLGGGPRTGRRHSEPGAIGAWSRASDFGARTRTAAATDQAAQFRQARAALTAATRQTARRLALRRSGRGWQLFRKNNVHLTGACTKLADLPVLGGVPELPRGVDGRPLRHEKEEVAPLLGRPFEHLDGTAPDDVSALPARRELAHLGDVLRVLLRVVNLRLDEEVCRHFTLAEAPPRFLRTPPNGSRLSCGRA